MLDELIDRYGDPPPSVSDLVNVSLVVLGHDAAFLPEAEKREIAGKF